MALTIIRQHVPPGKPFKFDGLPVLAGPAPTRSIGDGDLVQIFNAAADIWEGAILDDHTVTIQFGWSPLPLGGGIHHVRSQSGLPTRITEAIVYFDNNGSTMWFLDSTPHEHSEYPILVECFTNTGDGRLNSGRVLSGLNGLPGSMDLLTIAKHEIGHAIGFSTWSEQWIKKNAEHGIRLTPPRPFPRYLIPLDHGGHLRLHGALMESSLLPGQRKLISVIDVLAVAELGEFSELKLNPEEFETGNIHEDTSKDKTDCFHSSSLTLGGESRSGSHP